MHVGTIVITSADGAEQEIPLEQGRISLGSAAGNDIVLSGSDIAPRHASIRYETGGYLVIEIGSETLLGQGGMCLTFNVAQMTRRRDLAWLGSTIISYEPDSYSCQTRPMSVEAVSAVKPATAPAPCHNADETSLLHMLLNQHFNRQPAVSAPDAATLEMPMLALAAAK